MEFAEFTEYPNLDALNKILDNAFIKNIEGYQAYYKLAKNGDGNVKRSYSQKLYNGVPYGRFFVQDQKITSCALQWGAVRAELYKDESDIDIVNCCPAIALNICKKYSIRCPQLAGYVACRESYINDLDITDNDVENHNIRDTCNLTRQEFGKKIFTALIYGCGDAQLKKSYHLDKLPFKKNGMAALFKKEIKSVIRDIVALPVYSAMIANINAENMKSKKNKKLHDGSYFSLIIQNIETELVSNAISKFIDNGFIVTSRIHDGFQIKSKDTTQIQQIIDAINSDIDVKFIIKPFPKSIEQLTFSVAVRSPEQIIADRKLLDSTDQSTIPDNGIDYVYNTAEGVWTDVEAVDVLLQLHKHWISCKGILYVFDKETGMWLNEKSDYYRIIQKYSDHLHVLKQDKDDNIIKTVKSYGNTLDLMKKLPELISSRCKDDNWIDNVHDTSLRKILFRNGYYDANTMEFYSIDKIKPTIYFPFRLEMDYRKPQKGEFLNHLDLYETVDDEAEMDRLFKTYFEAPLGEKLGSYLVLLLAKALMGFVMKKALFCLGSAGNNGKSLLVSAMKKTCGPYVGIFNGENLAFKKSADEAQQLRWAMLLQFKRIIFSNELKLGSYLDANAIKKLSSGIDGIIARGHSGNETDIRCHFLSAIMANDLPTIKPYDKALDNRIEVFSYNKTFVEEKPGQVLNEFELKADPKLVFEQDTPEFKNSFIMLLINRYEKWFKDGKKDEVPEAALQSKQDWIETKANIVETFLNDFEFTNNAEDYIESARIKDWLRTEDLGVSTTKMALEIKKYATLQKLDQVVNKPTYIQAKKRTVWYGIRERELEITVDKKNLNC